MVKREKFNLDVENKMNNEYQFENFIPGKKWMKRPPEAGWSIILLEKNGSTGLQRPVGQ